MRGPGSISRIGDFTLVWGESLCWDDRRQRLYFVDCATRKLLWLDNAEPPLRELKLPSLPTGTGLADDGRVLIALDDGLNLVDPDSGSVTLMTPYPPGLGGRANDGTVDHLGGFVTGTLKAEPGEGSLWVYTSNDGWRILDEGITNANGHVSFQEDGRTSVVVADSPAQRLYACDLSTGSGARAGKRLFADTSELSAFPDGACPTRDGGMLSCMIRAGVLAHYTKAGLQQTIDAGSEQPSDVAFGGVNVDRLFVVSISVEFGHGQPRSPFAGALVEIRDTGLTGVVENRFRL